MGVFASGMSFDVPLLEHILMAERTVMLQCFSDPGKIYNVKPGTSFKSRTNPRIKQQRAMVRVARGYLMMLIAKLRPTQNRCLQKTQVGIPCQEKAM